jgi:YidC/Oxa1 family membrane protein insertase
MSTNNNSSSDLPSFGSSPIPPEQASAESAINSVLTASDLAHPTALPFEPTSWPSDQILVLLNYIDTHLLTSYPYAITIGATTLAFRVLLLPLFAKGQRNASRMAHIQPELKQLKDQMDSMGSKIDPATQQRYMQQTRALFKKYDCNPLLGLAAPLASAPFFISMFLGLRKAPDYFPDVMENGGLFWFMDLTQPDPYIALPILSAITFLGMTEVGKEQMMTSDPARGRVMINVFRAMAVAMVPFTMNFNAGVFVYWTVNNTWSFGQALLFKNKSVKKALGIWDPPKPVPGQDQGGSIFDEVQNLMKKKEEEVNALAKERIKAHNEMIAKEKKVKKIIMGGDRKK